jgi:hypothetical protein
MTFEVLTVVKMSMLVFWVVLPRRLVGTYECFGGTYCLHLQGYPEEQHRQVNDYCCFARIQGQK